MANRIELASGEYYHVFNRGTEKRRIFMNNAEYERFLACLYLCNSKTPVDLRAQGTTLRKIAAVPRAETLVDICAYCLMPNHFHLILREKENGISKFMQKVITSYTMYFNKKHGRSGALLQGRYKAKHAANDQYLSYLIAYIHLNPLSLFQPNWEEVGIANQTLVEQQLRSYRYSSYPEFCGTERPEKLLLNAQALPEYFDGPINFKKHLKFWLDYKSLLPTEDKG